MEFDEDTVDVGTRKKENSKKEKAIAKETVIKVRKHDQQPSDFIYREKRERI